MFDKPTPFEQLKVGDKVKYITHDSNGIEMKYGMIGTIKIVGIAVQNSKLFHIIWEGDEDKMKSQEEYWYHKTHLMKINNRPDYSAITKLIAIGT